MPSYDTSAGEVFEVLEGDGLALPQGVLFDGVWTNTTDPTDPNWDVGDIIDGPGLLGNYTYVGYYTSSTTGLNYPVVQPGGAGAFYFILTDDGTNLALEGALTDNFNVATDVTAGSSPPCFAAGTRIAMPTGTALVEQLSVGDMVLTAGGKPVPVLWVGESRTTTILQGHKTAAVRIKAGALGHGLPEQDLVVTGDHGMCIEGLVINASALVNHDTIIFEPIADLPTYVSYYHVELENHDVIMANGAPSETYLDVPGRAAFRNYQEYIDLYGAERLIPEMKMPRISSRRMLPAAIKARLGIVDSVEAMKLSA